MARPYVKPAIVSTSIPELELLLADYYPRRAEQWADDSKQRVEASKEDPNG